MLGRLILCISLVIASCGWAAGLTPRECSEIQKIYQISPPECRLTAARHAPTASARATNPSAKALENHIFFASGGSNLDRAALEQVAELARLLEGDMLAGACLQLIGHSDTSGPPEANYKLGQDRANQVQQALAARLKHPHRIEIVRSEGESAPLPDLPPDSKWQRRVELRARTCPKA